MSSGTVGSFVMPPPHRVSAVEAVMVVLRDQILDGHLTAGSPMREAELCASLGVSRHTARVALTNLAHEGLVRHEPNRGFYVRKLEADEVADCFRLRSILELETVRRLAGDLEALAAGKKALDRLVSIPDDAPWTENREADLAFHHALVGGLGSPHVARTFGSLMTELRLCFLMEGFEAKDQRANAADHQKIYDVIASGCVDEAVALLAEHLDSSRDNACRALGR